MAKHILWIDEVFYQRRHLQAQLAQRCNCLTTYASLDMGVLQCDNIVQSTDNVCIILDARAPIAPGAGSVEWAQYLELKGSYKMPRSGLTALAWFALKGKEPAWDGHAVILGTLGEGTLREHGIPTNVKCFHKDAMHHSREREDFFKEIDRILQLTRKP